MKFRFFIAVICINSCVLMSQLVLAHGPLQEQIAKVTEQIKQNPNDASLYLKRGELYRHHRDWSKALADYNFTGKLAPERVEVDFARGRMMLEAGWYEKAKAPLDRFLALYPKHPEALITRARVLVKLGENLAAAKDYTNAISHLDPPRPE